MPAAFLRATCPLKHHRRAPSRHDKAPVLAKGHHRRGRTWIFRDWLQDLACNHLINSIHSQHAASGPAGSRNHLCRFGVHLTDSG